MHLTTAMLPFAAALAASVIEPGAASAQVAPPEPPPARLGTAGQTILTSEWRFDIQFDRYDVADDEDVDRTTYDVHVGVDRVVGPGMTGGFRIGFSGFTQGLDTEKRFDLGGRFGVLLRLGGSTLVWPRLGLTYGSVNYGDRVGSVLVKMWTLSLSAPVLFGIGRHGLLGIGPTFEQDLSARYGANEGQTIPKRSGYGLHGFLGYWF